MNDGALTVRYAFCFCIWAEKNKKRDIRDWYANGGNSDRGGQHDRQATEAHNDVFRRGDIPVVHGDCDGRIWSGILGVMRDPILQQMTVF